jgi:DNA-binding FadR family transcriptional regulator
MVTSYAIRRRGLQAEIQQVVKRYIMDHHFKPGDLLPGEGELARQIGISRPSLREAMKVLQTIGAIETRHGSGTYVGSLSLDSLAEGLAFQLGVASQQTESIPRELLDLIELREAIETRQIQRVTGMHTDEQLRRLRALHDAMATADIPDGFRNLDLELHTSFYEPLDSQMAIEFIRCFWQVSNLGAYPFEEQHRAGIMADHHGIIEALARNDADDAALAMAEHIRRMARLVQSAYDAEHLRENAIMPGAEEVA